MAGVKSGSGPRGRKGGPAGKGAGKGLAKGGGKSRPGPRQPAARKEGGAGAPGRGSGGGRVITGKSGQAAYSAKKQARPIKPERTQRPQAEPVEHDDRVCGINPVLELLRSSGRVADTIYVDKDKGGKIIGDIIKIARKAGVTLKMVPKLAVDKLADGVRHQGVVAMVTPKEYADEDEMLRAAFERSDKPLIVLLDGVEDPRNLGSIIRSAEAAGADGVVIPEHRAARLNATVARASAGALEHLPVAKVGNLATFVKKLKDNGFWILGVEGGAEKNYTDFGMDVPLAIALGGEGTGLRDVVKAVCDSVVSIPMSGRVGSLNVSVAAGIALYEAVRQRSSKTSE